ncbi:hypothetical protein [Candidatus Nitrospira nitrificans]|uniref:Uncharacterized protein n=1 Tax=Candidatus Nitrospira nitrificans TaxID=1742973 RepID=A0A0S4L6H1_9BACT|nr:hypothetical protein [Candidatus Nitrospira nitrificans]CUS32377.1 hypothetical protein COMA2_100087 [Candidatus Nitrospira nitrificans]
MYKRLERLAKRKGTPVTDLVNQLLKKDLELPEACPSSRLSDFVHEDSSSAAQ